MEKRAKHGYRVLILGTFLAIVFYCLVSCDISKQAVKSKTDTQFSDKTEKTVFRAGDTVRVPSFNVTYKDTTIYTTNRQGTTIRTVYDVQGQVKNIECYASRIEEITRMNVQMAQQLKEKAKAKEEKTNFTWLIYVMLGVVVVLCFTIYIYANKLSGIKKAIQSV